MPRAKAASSLPSPEADIDDLNNTLVEPGLLTTTKRARRRPPGASTKVTKPAAKKTRGSSARAEAAVAASARQLLAEKGQCNALPLLSECESKPLSHGSSGSRAGYGRPEACSAKTSLVRSRPSGNPSGPKAGGPAVLDRTTKLDDFSTIVEIPETQEIHVLRPDESEDAPAVFDELCTAKASAGNDVDIVSFRRRLGDLTKRYQNLEMRHRDLREVGVKVAERNFDSLMRQAEENAATSNRLISQLKEDVAAQMALVEQGQDLQRRLEHSEANSNSLQAEVDGLTTALSNARGEIATLSARLAASRNVEAAAAAANSTRRTGTAGCKTGEPDIVQVAQAKEDLYGDLTGLIVRGLRRGDEEDLFDCIQTGRNGTLHFKLALEHGSRTDSYEDVQLTYRPQLDADRDSELMEVLPDYLVEEITFPRSHASKFYSRVIKSLSERTD